MVVYAYVYWMRGSAHTHVSSFVYVRRIHNMLGPCLLFEFGWLDVGNVLRCNLFCFASCSVCFASELDLFLSGTVYAQVSCEFSN